MKPLFKPRASALGTIMTEPKAKSEILSVGAKTYLYNEAKKIVYGYDDAITSKYTDKGLAVEDTSIELYNAVHFTSYTKNEERRENDWVGGTCDIFTGSKIIDIKSSWSLATFPALPERGTENLYEWQLRAYMMLWDVDAAEIAYCLVTTPEDLVGYEREELHFVDHIPQELRVTRIPFTRDKALEDRIKTVSEAAQAYVKHVITEIASHHQG